MVSDVNLVNLCICQRWVMVRLKSKLLMLSKDKGSLECSSMPGEEGC